ncbi:septum formation initiator family protein [Candidatus Parcubacteria bacterium]|nr:septum formation initiator family protein [Candidatus Parcubacteria bacterium]
MQNRREQQLPKAWRVLASPFFLLFLIVFVGLAGKGSWNMYLKSQEAQAGRVDVEHRLGRLESRAAFLEGEVNRLHTEAGLELAIREAFNVSKEGEKVYVIVDHFSTTSLPDETVTESVLRWFRDLFKKGE